MPVGRTIDSKFPRKLIFLFNPMAYKVAYGGRGGAKSWGFARALLLLGINEELRILCTREVQDSIKHSVHKLLEDQISRMGLGANYKVFDQSIRGSNGSEFIFSGLSNLTVETIKSYEGCDIVWVEEGQTISKRSWDILIPTIRKERFTPTSLARCQQAAGGDIEDLYKEIRDKLELSPDYEISDADQAIEELRSGETTPLVEAVATDPAEIWVSFNPSLETDPTYELFITNPLNDSIVMKMNWRDNPWFNKAMNDKRLAYKQTSPKNYPNIWEGECKPAVEGAIFFDEMQDMALNGRLTTVPYDPMLKVQVVTDIGYRHACGVALVQVLGPAIRVLWYKEFFGKKLSTIASELKASFAYNWGKVWLPFADGFSKTSKGQDSAETIFRASGFEVAQKSDVYAQEIESGIRVTRERFGRFYWDKENCPELIDGGRRYCRTVNIDLVAGAPKQDAATDAGDVIRYIATNANNMRNDTDMKPRGTPRTYRPHVS